MIEGEEEILQEAFRLDRFNTQLEVIKTVLVADRQWTIVNDGHSKIFRIHGKGIDLNLNLVANSKGIEETTIVEVAWFDKNGQRRYAVPLRPRIIIEPMKNPKSVTFKGIEIKGRKNAVTTAKISEDGKVITRAYNPVSNNVE